jgi:RNA polymerase sigma factor (sigma-70 family)
MKELNSESSEFPSDAVRAFAIAVRADNQAAASTAYTRLKSYLARLAKTYCKSPEDWPRFEQAALIALARTAQQFRSERGKPIEHLVRVAVKHAMVDELKKDAIRFRRFEFFGLVPTFHNDGRFQDSAPSPADLLIQSELRSHLAVQVHLWLQKRPPLEREFILLHFFEDLSQAEIARRLGVSRAAVSKRRRSTIARARVELANLQEFLAVN